MAEGEDERSVSHHVGSIKNECQKLRPNMDVIRQCLHKVRKYARVYIQEHTTAEVLKEFPCFSIPVLVSVVFTIYYIVIVITQTSKFAGMVTS